MKKLIYFPFALFIVLMAASCSKDSSNIVIPNVRDTTNVTMINASGSAYEVAFLGEIRYIVDIPAAGRQEVTVKAGNYDINVYPTSIAASHTITWSNLAPVVSDRAYFSSVPIKAKDHTELSIY
jgi:hypothetical protein